MSIALIKIKEEEIPILKKIVAAFTGAKIRIVKDEEVLMAELIDEGLASEIVSETTIKKEFKKHGVSF